MLVAAALASVLVMFVLLGGAQAADLPNLGGGASGAVSGAVAQPCLVIDKLAFPVEPVPATWDIHYTLIVRNGCAFECTNVVVTDTIDSRTYYHESDPLFDQLIGRDTFVWYRGDLTPGQQDTILLRVVTGPSLANQTVHNEASVDSDQTVPVTVVRDTQMGPVPPSATATATGTPTASPTATQTATPRPTNTPRPSVELYLDPSSSAVAEGDTFEVSMRIDAGAQVVDGAEVHLDFDPFHLQVVDAGGNPASGIENSGILDVLILNQVDNAAGQIDFAAGTWGALPSGSFVLATMHFKALQGTAGPGTALTFVTELPRLTNVTHAGASILAQAHDGIVHIGEATPTPTSTPPIRRWFLPIVIW